MLVYVTDVVLMHNTDYSIYHDKHVLWSSEGEGESESEISSTIAGTDNREGGVLGVDYLGHHQHSLLSFNKGVTYCSCGGKSAVWCFCFGWIRRKLKKRIELHLYGVLSISFKPIYSPLSCGTPLFRLHRCPESREDSVRGARNVEQDEEKIKIIIWVHQFFF